MVYGEISEGRGLETCDGNSETRATDSFRGGGGEAAGCDGGGEGILTNEAGFSIFALGFHASLVRRPLNVMGGSTHGSDSRGVIDLVRGPYRTWKSCAVR